MTRSYVIATILLSYIPSNSSLREFSSHSHQVNALRDGKEVIVRLKSKETAHYYFHVKADEGPFWFIVTPCGGTVNWRLTQQLMQFNTQTSGGHNKEENSIEASGITSYDNELYNQIVTQSPLSMGSKDFGNSLPMPVSLHSQANKLIMRHKSLFTNKISDDHVPSYKYETDLVHEVGCERMEYFSESLPTGILHFYAESNTDNTVVRIFATRKEQKIDEFFPRLPPRQKNVHLINISSTEAHIKWEHSPSASYVQNQQIKYCLALSREKDYKSYCEFQRTESEPENNGNFWKSNRLSNANSLGKKKYTDDFYIFNKNNSNVPLMKCTKYKTSFHFAGLFPNTEYKVSLFAINRESGGSTTYEGLSFRTPDKNKPLRERQQLQDSKMLAAFLNPSRSATHTYEIRLNSFIPEILVTIQPCSGYIRVMIYKDKRLLRKSVIGDLRRYIISRVNPGTLRIKIMNDDNTAKVFKIWSSINAWKDPYPRLPEDTSIKAFEASRGCKEVTLVWLPSRGHVRYCLYKRMEADDYFKKLILEETRECPSLPKEGLVKCQRHWDKGIQLPTAEQPLILNMTVSGLIPGTTYRFDLLVETLNKPFNQLLTYRTVWVKTRRKCFYL